MNINESKKYVTLNEGMDFRQIAKVMSAKGYKMNHATARNQLMMSIESVIAHAVKELNLKLSQEEIQLLAKNQNVHDALQDVLYLAYMREKDNLKG